MSRELALLGRIAQLSREPDVCLDEFERCVSASPRLAAGVVRVANSALYGMQGRIHELRRAVLILGVENVTAIATAILVARELRGCRIGPVPGDALWVHSLNIAVASQLVCRALGYPLEAESYLTGLLHELGMLDLHREHGLRYAALLERVDPALALDELEAADLGETHAQRLEALMRGWEFPDLLQQAAGSHHAPHGAPSAARPLAAVVRAAHAIVGADPSDFCDAPADHAAESALAELSLQPEDVADVRSELSERMKELAGVF